NGRVAEASVPAEMPFPLAFIVALALPLLETKQYLVEGTPRSADIYAPARPSARPALVFGFHGHGGSAANAARTFHIHELWPEAVVVYLQGLPTPGGRTDAAGLKAGWQVTAGGQGDRDLKFFDAAYSDLTKRFRVDLDRVYAIGHSNGGRFVYLL